VTVREAGVNAFYHVTGSRGRGVTILVPPKVWFFPGNIVHRLGGRRSSKVLFTFTQNKILANFTVITSLYRKNKSHVHTAREGNHDTVYSIIVSVNVNMPTMDYVFESEFMFRLSRHPRYQLPA
jgi:hypothetical protein